MDRSRRLVSSCRLLAGPVLLETLDSINRTLANKNKSKVQPEVEIHLLLVQQATLGKRRMRLHYRPHTTAGYQSPECSQPLPLLCLLLHARHGG